MQLHLSLWNDLDYSSFAIFLEYRLREGKRQVHLVLHCSAGASTVPNEDLLSNEQRLDLHCLSGGSLKVIFPIAAFPWVKSLISKSKAKTVAINPRVQVQKPHFDFKSPFQEKVRVSSSFSSGLDFV